MKNNVWLQIQGEVVINMSLAEDASRLLLEAWRAQCYPLTLHGI